MREGSGAGARFTDRETAVQLEHGTKVRLARWPEAGLHSIFALRGLYSQSNRKPLKNLKGESQRPRSGFQSSLRLWCVGAEAERGWIPGTFRSWE